MTEFQMNKVTNINDFKEKIKLFKNIHNVSLIIIPQFELTPFANLVLNDFDKNKKKIILLSSNSISETMINYFLLQKNSICFIENFWKEGIHNLFKIIFEEIKKNNIKIDTLILHNFCHMSKIAFDAFDINANKNKFAIINGTINEKYKSTNCINLDPSELNEYSYIIDYKKFTNHLIKNPNININEINTHLNNIENIGLQNISDVKSKLTSNFTLESDIFSESNGQSLIEFKNKIHSSNKIPGDTDGNRCFGKINQIVNDPFNFAIRIKIFLFRFRAMEKFGLGVSLCIFHHFCSTCRNKNMLDGIYLCSININ